MFRIAISRYAAKIIISQIILLLIFLSLFFYISILRQKVIEEIYIIDEKQPETFVYISKPCNNESIFETYPAEPTIKNCENMTTCRYNFCFADVAEITKNLTVCNMIFDPEIRVFCIAKVTLNSTKCLDVNDTMLKDACLESIEMKK